MSGVVDRQLAINVYSEKYAINSVKTKGPAPCQSNEQHWMLWSDECDVWHRRGRGGGVTRAHPRDEVRSRAGHRLMVWVQPGPDFQTWRSDLSYRLTSLTFHFVLNFTGLDWDLEFGLRLVKCHLTITTFLHFSIFRILISLLIPIVIKKSMETLLLLFLNLFTDII